MIMMTEHDKALVEAARHACLGDKIEETAAETEEGRQALHDIAVANYHREEYLVGVL